MMTRVVFDMLYCSLVIYLKNRNLEASNECYLFECWVISFVLSSIIHQAFANINVVKHTSSNDTRIKHANFKILITLKIVNSRRVMGPVGSICVGNTSVAPNYLAYGVIMSMGSNKFSLIHAT
jgi:hypothetical protein